MRVYLPLSWDQLGRLARGPVAVPAGHAVTEQVRSELAGADDEELEYAVLSAAAADAIALTTPDRPRRVVVVAETSATPTGSGSEVALVEEVRLRDVAALHVDDAEACGDVLAASAAPGDERLVDKVLDHQLGWYAVQELPELLA